MPARVAGTGGAIALLVWLMLDSGLVTPVRAARSTSAALVILAVLFGLGAWGASVGGQRDRSPLLASVALGVGGYGILRLLVF